MKLKTALAIAVAAAFALPVAAQTSADADRSASTEKAERGATAKGGFAGIDKNRDGYLSRDEARDAEWNSRFSELDKDNDDRLSRSEFDAMQAGAGATGGSSAPLTGGSNAADRKPNTPKQ
jgi:hypothetical protein